MKIVNLKYEKCEIYCGRGTSFGNKFRIGVDGTRDEVCDKYEEYFNKRIANDPKFKAIVLKLKGKICGCWCKMPNEEVRCHLDTIKNFIDNQPKSDIL
jgi:hypothetical protein